MSLLPYFLKSTVCLFLFWAFYTIFLERESMHGLKRFYLLITLASAFTIPAITFTQIVEVPYTIPAGITEYVETPFQWQTRRVDPDTAAGIPWLWIVYLLGTAFFALRFAHNLYSVLRRMRKNPRIKRGRSILVLLRDRVLPHTFLRYVFLNRADFKAQKVPKEVLWHEEAHAIEKHSLDILLLEALQILFWFNPALLLMRNAIKLNHEFLADRAVTRKGIPKSDYQEIILVYSSNQYRPFPCAMGMVNAIHLSSYTSIKKRFTVMKKRTSKSSGAVRAILVLPLLGLLLFGFSETKTVFVKTNPCPQETIQKNKPTQNALAQWQEGLTKKQMREYNTLASKYNKMLAQDDHVFIKSSDVDRLVYLHAHMTEAQREGAQPFPTFPGPPEPPSPPMAPEEELVMLQEQMAEKQLHRERQHLVLEQKAKEMEVLHLEMEEKAALMEKEECKIREEAQKLEGQSLEREQKAMEMEQKNLEIEQKVLEMQREAREMKIPKPEAPNAPRSPVEHIKEMAQQNALFYHNEEEISAEKAIEILQKNHTRIKIKTRHKNLERPEIQITTVTSRGLNPTREASKTSLPCRVTLKKVPLNPTFSNQTVSINNVAGRLKLFQKSCCPYAQYYLDGNPIATKKALHLFIKNKTQKITVGNTHVPGLSLSCPDLPKKS
ncbi:MAG: M56 family metallopeptidase [Bacteroidota bacterium]